MNNNIKTYLKQLLELSNKLDTKTGNYTIYDFLTSITQSERDELWELCNELQHILHPIKLLQKQIDTSEKSLNGFEEKAEDDFMPSGAEIIKSEVSFISNREALSFATHNINQLLKQL